MLSNKRRLLIGVLLIAVGLRVAALVSFSGSVYSDQLLWDEKIYHDWAVAIADGSYDSDSVYDFAPLPAYVNAFVYRLAGPDVFWIRVANLILGACTCFFVFLVGRQLGDSTTGLISGLAAALYGPLVLYSVVPLKTALSLFCFSASMALLLFVLKRLAEQSFSRTGSGLCLAGLGAMMGLMINVRANYAPVVLLVPLFLWMVARRCPGMKGVLTIIAPFVFGVAMALLPFVLRNVVVAGEFALTTSQTGRNLYFGNNLEHADPYYRPVRFASSVPDEQAVQFVIEASRRAGKTLTPSETSRFWTREVMRLSMEQPLQMAAKLGRKILVLFNSFEAGDHYQLDFLAEHIPFFKAPLLRFGLVFPLALAGLFACRRMGLVRILATIGLVYGATLILFVTNTRYRLPLVVILIPLAVLGCQKLIESFRQRNRTRVLSLTAIVIVAAGLENLPVRGVGDMTAYYNTHALVLDRRGDTNGAVEFWETSMKLDGSYSPLARLFLAGKYFERRDVDLAFRTAQQINDNSYAAAAKYALLGDMFHYRRDLGAAVDAYERSLEINSGQRRIRHALVDIYMKQHKLGEAARQSEKITRIEKYFGTSLQ